MTRDEAVSRIQRRLGFRVDSFEPTAIRDELILAQEELELELLKSPPWFLLTEMSTESNTIDEERMALPTDFLAEYDHGFLYRYDASLTDPWIEMSKGFYGGLKAEYTEPGTPKTYSIVGKYIMLHPQPDEVFTWKMRYYAADTLLTTADGDESNNWLIEAGNVIMNSAGMAMAENMKDRLTGKYFENKFVLAYKAMMNETHARKMRNMNLVREDI